jgi:hypothetical protein
MDRINFFGVCFGLLFFLSLGLLPRPRAASFDFAIGLFSAISSATFYAVERANADIIMFLIIVLGVLACGSGPLLRMAGYAVITLAGLLKFYPMVALILATRERMAIFVSIAFGATIALGGLALFYWGELVQMANNLSWITNVYFIPIVFGAKDLPAGVGVLMSEITSNLYHNATGAELTGRLVRDGVLSLLILLALAIATQFGRRCRLQYAVERLGAREADFLLVGSGLICGSLFAGENNLYRGIFLLLAVPGLLTLSHQSTERFGRIAFRGTCVTTVLVLWFPFIQACISSAVRHLLDRPIVEELDRLVRPIIWACGQLAWWWIIVTLLSVLGAFMLNSELWASLSRIPALPRRGSPPSELRPR